MVKPDISHLHPIGCTAYAKMPMERSGSKLDAWSIKDILISYFGCDAYRIFDPETWRIFYSRDVIFEEGTGHDTLPLMDTSSGGSNVILNKSLDAPTPALPNPDAQTRLATKPDLATNPSVSALPAQPTLHHST